MAHHVATVFALTMAVWVADVRLAPPRPVAPVPAVAAASCHSGRIATPSPGADEEFVVCGTRLP
jgi:hypothetical protein